LGLHTLLPETSPIDQSAATTLCSTFNLMHHYVLPPEHLSCILLCRSPREGRHKPWPDSA